MEIPIEEWLTDDRTLQNEGISERIFSLASSNYQTKTGVIGGVIKDFEKQILLQVIDNAWKDHLGSVEYLRQGIGLRGYGSRNPKLEFRKESFELFENLLDDIRYEATRFLARVQIEVDDKQELEDIKKSKTKETYEHQSSQSAFGQSEPKEEPSQVNENQGNRRLRRYEAKMARKKGNKE